MGYVSDGLFEAYGMKSYMFQIDCTFVFNVSEKLREVEVCTHWPKTVERSCLKCLSPSTSLLQLITHSLGPNENSISSDIFPVVNEKRSFSIFLFHLGFCLLYFHIQMPSPLWSLPCFHWEVNPPSVEFSVVLPYCGLFFSPYCVVVFAAVKHRLLIIIAFVAIELHDLQSIFFCYNSVR